MIGESPVSLREFLMQEPLPLTVIHDAVLEYLQGRDDAVLFGAQAVNAYSGEPRATQDVDVASTRGRELADELWEHLAARFHIAVRVREVAGGEGFRIYQVRREGNRRLVDVRPVATLPPSQRRHDLLVVAPHELIAGKFLAFVSRQGRPKAYIDRRDLALLLLRFPELKEARGPVRERLEAAGAAPPVLAAWEELVQEEILPDDEDGKFR
jgi:hypothetical protein